MKSYSDQITPSGDMDEKIVKINDHTSSTISKHCSGLGGLVLEQDATIRLKIKHVIIVMIVTSIINAAFMGGVIFAIMR